MGFGWVRVNGNSKVRSLPWVGGGGRSVHVCGGEGCTCVCVCVCVWVCVCGCVWVGVWVGGRVWGEGYRCMGQMEADI